MCASQKTQGSRPARWIGIDLDGTLAHYDEFNGPDAIGEPVPLMLSRVKSWLSKGIEVKIFTARVHSLNPHAAKARIAIEAWCEHNIGKIIPITCEKDPAMLELWDDRCVQIEKNTGRRIDGKKA